MRRKRALSKREGEALALLAEGLTNREIATRMGTAQGTVHNQLLAIYAKLGVDNRVQAARLFWEQERAA